MGTGGGLVLPANLGIQDRHGLAWGKGYPRDVSLLRGHEIWEAKFTEALNTAKETAEGSPEREQAFAVLRKLGLTDGDILYWIYRGKARRL